MRFMTTLELSKSDFTDINLGSNVGLITCLVYTDISRLERSGDIGVLYLDLFKQIGLLF